MPDDDLQFDLAALEHGQAPANPQPLPRHGIIVTLPKRQNEDGVVPPPSAPPNSELAASAAEESRTADAPVDPAPPVAETPQPVQEVEPPAALPGALTAEPPGASPAAPSTEPDAGPAEPPVPAPSLDGLSSAEVHDRITRGLVNRDDTPARTDWDVVRENLFTFFNMVLGSLIAALFVLAIVDQNVGNFQDGIFVGIVVAANVAVGTFQEIRATRMLRKLVALSAPRATVIRGGQEQQVFAIDVVQGDLVRLRPGDQVVADGHIVAEAVELDESLLTGESSSVRKEPADAILSGSFCTAGSGYYVAEHVGAEAYAVKLTADARKLVRRLTPLQIRFNRILRILLFATAGLGTLLVISFAVNDSDVGEAIRATTATISSVVPEGLLLGLTVAFAVGAVRVSRAGALVQDISAVEAMNYVDVVCLDKTGTITANRLTLSNVHWAPEAQEAQPWLGALAVASEGESRTADALAERLSQASNGATTVDSVPFNSERRWSARRLRHDGVERTFVLGAPETIVSHCDDPAELAEIYRRTSGGGLRGVFVAEAETLPDAQQPLPPLRAVALVTVADVLRPQVAQAFATMAELGVEPKIISGDNPATVTALISQLGITLQGGGISGAELEQMEEEEFDQAVAQNSVFGRIAPAQKARIVDTLRTQGHFVAMIGDGANDVRALRAADVAVAMESGSGTARAVAGIILRDDSFAAFVEATVVAQSVLGNSTQLAKLFITKSFYAFLIIIATNMLGLDFPFLPRHGSLTALFTLGIPAVFITLTKPPSEAGRDFTSNILRFAIPASLALAAATISVHLLTQGFLDRSIEEARTLVSLTIGIVGIYYMVEVIGFTGVSGRAWFRSTATAIFGTVLLGLFILVIYTPVVRDFFDFAAVGVAEWAIVIPAVISAMIGQYVISRYWREIVRWIVRPESEYEVSRGRAI